MEQEDDPLLAVGLPLDVARLILQQRRAAFAAQYIAPMEEQLGIVNLLKRILRPCPEPDGEYSVQIDMAVLNTSWDTSYGKRNLAVLFRYCDLVERIVNGWGSDFFPHKPSAGLILMVWNKRRSVILSTYHT